MADTDEGDRTAAGSAALRVSGLYARFRGKTYRAISYSGGRFRGSAVLRISDDEVADFGDLVPDKPRSPQGPVAHVPLHELDGFVSVDLVGRFGGREVQVTSIEGEMVGFYVNAPSAWGREHHLRGSQHEGYRGTAPRGAVEIVGEKVIDLLATEMRRPSVGS